MNLLKLPSQKIFARHLTCCTAVKASNPSTISRTKDIEHNLWNCQLPHKSFTVLPLVWIQGTVVQILDSGSMIVADDGTGIVVLCSCDKINSKIAVSKGMYIMAIGTLQSSGQHPMVKPIKLQDLSHVEYAETAWPLEVLDQMYFLNG